VAKLILGAAVISIDGFGDFSSVMWGAGQANQIQVKGSVLFPHSLGIFYTRVPAMPRLPQVR
jgi:carbamoyltransferase